MGNQCKTNNCYPEGILEVEHTPMDIFQKIVRIQSIVRGFLAKRQLKILSQHKKLITREREILIKYEFPRLQRIISPSVLKNQIEIVENDKFAYIGQVNKEGNPHGFGRLINKDKTYKEGEFSNGELRRGTYYLNNILLQGTFQNSLLHGRGRTVQRDKSIYEGGFEKGERSGYGKLIDPKGNVYEGQFKYGFMNGEGEYYGKDGKYYVGEWLNGKQNGKGELVYPDGQKYVGDFENQFRHGFGELITQYGKYVGQWQYGKQHGEGLLIIEGKEIKGIWVNGQKRK